MKKNLNELQAKLQTSINKNIQETLRANSRIDLVRNVLSGINPSVCNKGECGNVYEMLCPVLT